MDFDNLKFVPFVLWIACFALGIGATLSSPHLEGSGFKGVHQNSLLKGATKTQAP